MGFLERIPELIPETFDENVQAQDFRLKLIFFWGLRCPNCEVAKKILEENHISAMQMNLDWFHVNTYEHADLGTRFGLHGIPTFLLFKNGKTLGRMTSFPGWEPFAEVLAKFI